MQMPEQPKSHWTLRVTMRLRRYFLTGLAILLPVVVTLFVIVKVFQFADGLLGQFINRWLRTYGYEIPGLGLIITALLILVVGMLSSHFFGQWVVRSLEGWFTRLPVIRRIYPPVKQLADFLFAKETHQVAFRRVVLVQYPRLGVYSLAFVTNESTTTVTGASKTLLTLLIPNPPSPFTGPIIFVPKEEVIPLDLSIEEAVKLVVSGGIVAPPLEASGEQK